MRDEDRQLEPGELERMLQIPKLSSSDPEFIWYLDRQNYATMAPELGLSTSEYEHIAGEVLNVFPLEWARSECDRIAQDVGGSGFEDFSVTPFFQTWLPYHPIPMLLLGHVTDWSRIFPLLKIGRDLIVTKPLPGIAKLRAELIDFEQYIGRLFELDVLSVLHRSSLQPAITRTPDCKIIVDGHEAHLEIRHRGTPFGLSVASSIQPPWLDNWGEFVVSIKTAGGKSERRFSHTLSGRITSMIRDMASSQTATTYEDGECSIAYDPNGQPRTITTRYGNEDSYASELERLTILTLREKAAQLSASIAASCPCFIALDCRSLLPPIDVTDDPTGYYHYPKCLTWRAAIIDAGQRFLDETPGVRGVMFWWPRVLWRNPRRLSFTDPVLVSVLTPKGEVFSTSSNDIAEVLALAM